MKGIDRYRRTRSGALGGAAAGALAAALALGLFGCGPANEDAEPPAPPLPSAQALASALRPTATPPDYGERIGIEVTGALGGRPVAVGGERAETWLASRRALYRLDLTDPSEPRLLGPGELFPHIFWQVQKQGDTYWALDAGDGIWRRSESCEQEDCWTRVWLPGGAGEPEAPGESSAGDDPELPPDSRSDFSGAEDVHDFTMPDAAEGSLFVLTDRGLRVLRVADELRETAFFRKSEDARWVDKLRAAGPYVAFEELTPLRQPNAFWRVRRFRIDDPGTPVELSPLELPSPGSHSPWTWFATLIDGRIAVDSTPFEWSLTMDHSAVSPGIAHSDTWRWANLVDVDKTVLITTHVASALTVGPELLYLSGLDPELRLLDPRLETASRLRHIANLSPSSAFERHLEPGMRLHGPAGDVIVVTREDEPGLSFLDLRQPERGEVGRLDWPSSSCKILRDRDQVTCRSMVHPFPSFDVMPIDELAASLSLPPIEGAWRAPLPAVPAEEGDQGPTADEAAERRRSEWPVRVGEWEIRLLHQNRDARAITIESVDVSNPDDPRVAARTHFAGFASGASNSDPRQLEGYPGLVFFDVDVYNPVTESLSGGLAILDIRDPRNVSILGRVSDLGHLTDIVDLGNGHFLAAAGGMLYGLRLDFDADE